MKSIDTLIKDIYQCIADGNHTWEHFMYEKSQNSHTEPPQPAQTTPRLRFSNVGTQCTRKLWYMINTPEYGEEFSPEVLLKFQYGHLLEEYLLWLAVQAGHSVTYQQHEVEIEGVKGHIDAIIDGHLVDVKTASGFGFKKFKENNLEKDDPFGYLVQLSLYHYAVSREGLVDPELPTYFLAINKDNGELCLTPYSPFYHRDEQSQIDWVYEEEFGAPVIVQYTEYQVHQDEPPERLADEPDGQSGNRKLGVYCSYCSFKNHCWSNLRTFLYSGKPRFLTVVKREPNVTEITNEQRESF